MYHPCLVFIVFTLAKLWKGISSGPRRQKNPSLHRVNGIYTQSATVDPDNKSNIHEKVWYAFLFLER